MANSEGLVSCTLLFTGFVRSRLDSANTTLDTVVDHSMAWRYVFSIKCILMLVQQLWALYTAQIQWCQWD